MTGYLALEDGSLFPGESFGADVEAAGEVVFTTGMTGYQEVVTDPSFAGQLVVMTCPHIGNTGINSEDMENLGAPHPALKALLVRDYCDRPSNWRSSGTLAAFLREQGVPALTGIDTRALTRRLRSRGVMRGILVAGLRRPGRSGDARRGGRPDRRHRLGGPGDGLTPKRGRARHGRSAGGAAGLRRQGQHRRQPGGPRLPGHRRPGRAPPPKRSLALQPHGVLVSNGPGDPAVVTYVASDRPPAGGASGRGGPAVFGICLGHQILALALGGRTYKLKFGHRGCNHPVKDLISGRAVITTQNHGYAVDAGSLAGTGLVYADQP